MHFPLIKVFCEPSRYIGWQVCSLHSSITLLPSFPRSQAPMVVLNKALISLEML